MMKIKDNSGQVMSGIFKDERGNLIVKNDLEYRKYLQSKQQQETINNLSKEVSDLKSMMQEILSTLKNSSNDGKL